MRHVLKCGLRGAASFSASTLILNPWLFLEFKLGDVGELTFSECWRYRLRLGPDLSMIGYAANAQVGATAYTYAFPLILTAYALGSGHHIVFGGGGHLDCAHRIGPLARIRPEISDILQGHPPQSESEGAAGLAGSSLDEAWHLTGNIRPSWIQVNPYDVIMSSWRVLKDALF